MKNIIYAFLFLALPISMAGKDSTAIKADSPAATQAAKQEEIKAPLAPSIVKHDTVYVAVKEMPGENWLTTSTIISIIALVLSFFAAIFTYYEMRQQRLAAYKPELIVPGIRISGEINMMGSQYEFRYFEYKTQKVILKDISFNIVNIGPASAKNVIFTVSIDKEQFIKVWQELENININTGISFYHKQKGKIIPNLTSTLHDITAIVYKQLGFNFDTVSYFPYLLPVEGNSDVANSTKLYIPECYTYLFTLYNLYKSKTGLLIFPNLKIKFSFDDHLNAPHKCEFEFQPKFLDDIKGSAYYAIYFSLESKIYPILEFLDI